MRTTTQTRAGERLGKRRQARHGDEEIDWPYLLLIIALRTVLIVSPINLGLRFSGQPLSLIELAGLLVVVLTLSFAISFRVELYHRIVSPLRHLINGFSGDPLCDACDGWGRRYGEDCRSCAGYGKERPLDQTAAARLSTRAVTLLAAISATDEQLVVEEDDSLWLRKPELWLNGNDDAEAETLLVLDSLAALEEAGLLRRRVINEIRSSSCAVIHYRLLPTAVAADFLSKRKAQERLALVSRRRPTALAARD